MKQTNTKGNDWNKQTATATHPFAKRERMGHPLFSFAGDA